MTRPADAHRILVVDDDPHVRLLLERLLDAARFEVTTLADAPTDVTRLAGEHDLVLLDVDLPSEDGRDTLVRIRAASAVPVILITGAGAPADCIAGLELGADDYVTKPFSIGELVARIRAVLRRTCPEVPART